MNVAIEKARLPIGTRVKVRGCPGLGVGVVREHITEHRFSDGRPSIPFVDHVRVGVELEWLDEGRPLKVVETFHSHELAAVSS